MAGEVYRDTYREVPAEKVIEFPDTPSGGEWAGLFSERLPDGTPGGQDHPAKMNQLLVRFLIERYTREGDVVLDPMAGAMSTVIQASLLGRHGVGVEYEAWMVAAARRSLERLERYETEHFPEREWGRAVAVHGDSRRLSEILREAPTAAVTSPPYADTLRPWPRTVDESRMGPGGRGFLEHVGYAGPDNGGTHAIMSPPFGPDAVPHGEIHEKGRGQPLPRDGYADPSAVIVSPPDGDALRGGSQEGPGASASGRASTEPGYGAALLSPPYPGPYAEEHSKARGGKVVLSLAGGRRDYSGDPDNIGHKKYGAVEAAEAILADHAMLSPPHGPTQVTTDRNILTPKNPSGHVEPADVIRQGHANHAIVSPPHGPTVRPHGDSEKAKARRTERQRAADEAAHARGQRWSGAADDPRARMEQIAGPGYSDDPANVGNLPYGNPSHVITSPPHGEALHTRGRGGKFTEEADRRSLPRPYSQDDGNVGNLWYGGGRPRPRRGRSIGRKSGETYLEAMALVYAETFRVLRPGGLMIVTVKNFVRRDRPVLLSEDTARLLRAAGFVEVDQLYRRIGAKSFWIRVQEEKFRRRQGIWEVGARLGDGLAPAAKARLEGLLRRRLRAVPPDWPIPFTTLEDVLIFKKPEAA